VSRAISRIAASSYRSLTVITGVTTESSLIDFAIWSPIERKAHVLKVNNGID
jgi:hypothetical protein